MQSRKPCSYAFVLFVCLSFLIQKQNRSTEGCSKLKRSVDMTSSGKNGRNIRTNGTGPGVRRSKRPLLASRTRCNVLWKPTKLVIRPKSVVKSSSVINLQIGVMSDQLRVSLYTYGHVPFGRLF